MHLIRTSELPSQRWRNGAGTTRNIALDPNDDGSPGWRLSLADVDAAGDFSPYPGMERIFTLVAGELAVLRVDGVDHPLETFRPFRFDGEAAASCTLPTGQVKALNVFTAKSRYSAGVLVVELSKKQPLRLQEGQVLVLLKGSATAHTVGPDAVQEPGEDPQQALFVFDAIIAGPTDCEVSGRGFAALISIFDL